MPIPGITTIAVPDGKWGEAVKAGVLPRTPSGKRLKRNLREAYRPGVERRIGSTA
jgi:acyl-CoA synthetase (AMP-forming)/AMP-acid ligase II